MALSISGQTILNMDISILIRTKNEEKYLRQTLSAVYSQTYKNPEVLIVDSGSTDNTLAVAREFPVTIYEIRPEDFTWGYALNYGFKRASGKYVVCLSGHAIPLTERWLDLLADNFKDEKVAAAMSNSLPFPDCNPFDRRGLLKKFNIPKQEIGGGPPYIFANYSSMIRRSVWEEIPFDETLSYAEDHDWAMKVIKAGYKIIYEPEAKTYHSHNETLKQIYSRSFKEALARKTLGLQKYSLLSVLFDITAGSVYDMLYVLYKFDHIKWLFFAPLRRVSMNLARYKASLIKDDL
jgi:glycosyltransferase involved in cell wall biosynthesis